MKTAIEKRDGEPDDDRRSGECEHLLSHVQSVPKLAEIVKTRNRHRHEEETESGVPTVESIVKTTTVPTQEIRQ